MSDHDPGDPRYSRRSPCAKCPFSRSCTPGALGGSTPGVYIGQAEGPFLLTCHMSEGYDQSVGPQPELPQCAGAAIYRANLGVAGKMPDFLLSLPADENLVFASHAEFMAHHMQRSCEFARMFLRDVVTPEAFLRIELDRAGVRVVTAPSSTRKEADHE